MRTGSVRTSSPVRTSTTSPVPFLGSVRSLGSFRSLESAKWRSSPARDTSPLHYQAFDSVRSLGSWGNYKLESSPVQQPAPVQYQAFDALRGQTMDSLGTWGGSKLQSPWGVGEMLPDSLIQDVGSTKVNSRSASWATSAPQNLGVNSALRSASWTQLQPASWAPLQLASMQIQAERGIQGLHASFGKGVVVENAVGASGANCSYAALVTPCFASQHPSQTKEECGAGHKRRCRPKSHEESAQSKRISPGNAPSASMDAPKNKNCHYCEHAPKRTAFFACSSCEQTFCENCNSRHLGAPTYFEGQDDADRASWHCPICAKKCCCTLDKCDKNHLHCKRYRRKLKTIKGALQLKTIQGALGVAVGGQDSR